MKKGNFILNGFKGSNIQEIQKGILNPAKLDNNKYSIFSGTQIQEYLKSVISKNEGMALEIQKSVVANVKSEMNCLIPVNILHNGKVKRFYVAKSDNCIELCKAVEPVNKKEGYFDGKINEDEVLQFIDENDEVDDDMLIKKFGEDVTEILNSLEEDGKLDVNEDGFYFIKEENEEEIDNDNDDEDNDDEKDEDNNDEEEDENINNLDSKNNDDEEDNENENIEKEEDDDKQNEENNNLNEEEKEEDINNNNNKENNNEEENINSVAGGNTEELSFEENEENNQNLNSNEDNNDENENNDDNDLNSDINNEEENNEEGNENDLNDDGNDGGEQNGENDNLEENQDNLNQNINNGEKEEGNNSSNMTPEELEAFAKKTATVTLLKFYKNSTDEKLKEIAAIELKSRGVDVNNEQNNNGENGDLPENKAALDALEKFTKDYLGKYDNEDLISVVVELANQDPGKRKELKDLYRTFYSMNNNGNKLLKVDEDDFKTFLTDHYFNNFTPGDLQSYAYLLISKNPKEYRKYKKMMDLANEPII